MGQLRVFRYRESTDEVEEQFTSVSVRATYHL